MRHMTTLKHPVVLETAFSSYEARELIGQGGAGKVYGGLSSDGAPVAIKVLSDGASSDKRSRFRNEISFLAKNEHSNIVTVTDHGVANAKAIAGPFYVMRRYNANLRKLMSSGLKPEAILPIFSKILDGVEAAHLRGVIHRDLKPENILCDETTGNLAVADFGVAHFTEDLLTTAVETGPSQRLANFQYAAPEQRVPGRAITQTADIYALGLMLNELFTSDVPHGTEPLRISAFSADHAFLDDIASSMIRQDAKARPASISDVKALISKFQAEAVSLQRLSKFSGTVIKSGEVDDPLALDPPRLIDWDWEDGVLTLVLDRPVHARWVQALQNMGSHSSVYGKPPQSFSFKGDRATVQSGDQQVQPIINHFKVWLPAASAKLKQDMEQEIRRNEQQRRQALKIQRDAEERRLKLRQTIKI